ncbi:hypothetical protein ACH41H_46275, partial [Streptomyces sp. NPDC020800]
YQARLHARFGRAWRRKAPVESLMPLRLARYGIPLTKTAPAGLAAAGIDEPLHLHGFATSAGAPLCGEHVQALPEALQKHSASHASTNAEESSAPPSTDQSWHEYASNAARGDEQEPDALPHTAALAAHMYGRGTIARDGEQPTTNHTPADFVAGLQEREFRKGEMTVHDTAAARKDIDEPFPDAAQQQTMPDSAATPVAVQAASAQRGSRVLAPIDEPSHSCGGRNGRLTAPDRYYLAWMEYQAEHGHEPSDDELSVHLSHQGYHGRGGNPISPANLRRHFLHWRVYNVWAEHRVYIEKPTAEHVAQACQGRAITAQYNRPITPEYITAEAHAFERRWHTLAQAAVVRDVGGVPAGQETDSA